VTVVKPDVWKGTVVIRAELGMPVRPLVRVQPVGTGKGEAMFIFEEYWKLLPGDVSGEVWGEEGGETYEIL